MSVAVAHLQTTFLPQDLGLATLPNWVNVPSNGVSAQMPVSLLTKKVLREDANSSKAEPNIFALPQTPFLGAQDSQNFICWRRSLPLPTNPIWIYSCNYELAW